MQLNDLPTTGFLRISEVLRFIPVCKNTWLNGVKAGRYPAPTRALGRRITAWKAEDIRELIEKASASGCGR